MISELSTPFRVLDHGYILLVDVMGDDKAVVDAARVSYAAGTKKSYDDVGLLRYLLRSKHTSPFEQARLKFEIKLPLFVERQWVRHRMASLNEVSARYSVLPGEFYFPEPSSVTAQSTSNKQGRGELLPEAVVTSYLADLKYTCILAYARYEKALQSGVARELARCLLPVNIYTMKVWTCDLHNLLHFLALRMDSHAQHEIRQYANVIGHEIVAKLFPIAWQAFLDYRLNAVVLSDRDRRIIQAINRNSVTATSLAQDFGWLEKREDGTLKDIRERLEFEAKAQRLGFLIPW